MENAINSLHSYVEAHNGNKSEASRNLGISRRSLNRWLAGVHPIPVAFYDAIGYVETVEPEVVNTTLLVTVECEALPMPLMFEAVSMKDTKTLGVRYTSFQTVNGETFYLNKSKIKSLTVELVDEKNENVTLTRDCASTIPENEWFGYSSEIGIHRGNETTFPLPGKTRVSDETIFEDFDFVGINSISVG